MDQKTFEMIKTQTSIEDDDLIQQLYFQNNYDVIKTILEVQSIKTIEKNTIKQHNVFDTIRKILDDKDEIFQHLSNSRETQNINEQHSKLQPGSENCPVDSIQDINGSDERATN